MHRCNALRDRSAEKERERERERLLQGAEMS